MTAQPRVAVIGAGPVGVVAALACARLGYSVTLLEAAAAVDASPRASTTHPSTLEMLARLGLIDRFIAEGLIARHFQFWDRVNGTLVCEFDHDVLRDETPYPFVVQTEQHKLVNMGIEQLRATGCATVGMSTRVTAIDQDADVVSISAVGPDGHQVAEYDYAIAADGGRSEVRNLLGIEFDGYTWPQRFVVLTVADDFSHGLGCCYRNFFADPDEWTNLFKVGGDDGSGLWRAEFPTSPYDSDAGALTDEASQARLGRVMAQDQPFRILHRSLYRVHQRVARRFRHGRVFLAGDAAHVNNPLGGLGLNCGIHDATELVETLDAVICGRASADALGRYERRRRPLNIEFVQDQTIANKKLLEARNPEQRRSALDELRRTADDPVRHKAYLMRTSLLDSVRKARTIT